MTRRSRLALLLGLGAIIVEAACALQALADAPPLLDRSTPATQDGYTLTRIWRMPARQVSSSSGPERSAYEFYPQGPGGFAIWISSPYLPQQKSYPNAPSGWLISGKRTHPDTPVQAYARKLQVTGTASNGDMFALDPWLMAGKEGRFVMVHLPAGYSGDYRFIDVSLADGSGHKARWRFTRLPEMVRVIPQPVQVTDSATRDGISLKASAMWSHAYGLHLEPTVDVALPAKARNKWELRISRHYGGEWAPALAADRQTAASGTAYSPLKPGANHITGWHPIAAFPYVQASRLWRFSPVLVQYETHEETIVFRSVSLDETGSQLLVDQTQTLTTPSGLRVTMAAQSFPGFRKAKQARLARDSQPNLRLRIDQSQERFALPGCPLAQRYHLPVNVRFVPPPAGKVMGQSTSGSERLDLWQLPKGAPTFFKEFPVKVVYRVDLKTYPLTFTVPIRGADQPTASKEPRR